MQGIYFRGGLKMKDFVIVLGTISMYTMILFSVGIILYFIVNKGINDYEKDEKKKQEVEQ